MSGLKLKKKKRQLPKSHYIQKSVSLKEGFKCSGKGKSNSTNTFKEKRACLRKRRKNIIKSYSENEITADVAVKPAREGSSKVNQFFCQSLKKDNTNSFKNVLTRKRDIENINNSLPKKEDSKKSLESTAEKTIYVSLNFLENKQVINTPKGLKRLGSLRKSSLKSNPAAEIIKREKGDKSKFLLQEKDSLKLKNSRIRYTIRKKPGISISKKFRKTDGEKNETIVCIPGDNFEQSKGPSNDKISKIDEKYIKSLLCIVNERKAAESENFDLDCQKLKVTAKIGKLIKETEEKAKPEESEINKLKCWYHIKKEIAKDEDRCVQRRITEGLEDESKIEKSLGVKCKSREFNTKIEKSRKLKDSVAVLFARKDRSLKDIKELWKRNKQSNSATSLSSEADSEVHNELTELGIESYKHLKKIVEEEVLRICKNHENTPVEDKTLDQQKKIIKSPKIESVTAKEKDNQNAKKQNSANTGEEPQDKNLHKNKSELIKEKLKFLAEEKLTNGKLPSEIVKNWTILHRLQKAFLALGTPTFHSKQLDDFKKPKISNVKMGDVQYLKQKKSVKEVGIKNFDENRRMKRVEPKESRIKDCKISEYSIKKDPSKPAEGLIIIKSKKDTVLTKKQQEVKSEKKSDVKTALLVCNAKKQERKEDLCLISQKSFVKIGDKRNSSFNSIKKSLSHEKQVRKCGAQKSLKALVCISAHKEQKIGTRKPPEEKTRVKVIRSDQTVVLCEADTGRSLKKSISNVATNQTGKKVYDKKREKISNERTRPPFKPVMNNRKEVKERPILSNRGFRNESKNPVKTPPQNQAKRTQEVSKAGNKQNPRKRKFRMGSLFHTSSNSSGISTATYNVPNPYGFKKLFNSKMNEISSTSMSTSSANSVKAVVFEAPKSPEFCTQALWEQDIKYYHSIVKDIISQYKRINGFLKHSERLETSKTSITPPNNHLNGDNATDIREYRRKIVSEYQTLPIFEYKSMVQGENKKNTEDLEVKRNLLAVKALNSRMDFDVKDFQPKVQKILDAQVYVDPELCQNRNEPKKTLGKQSSLQEAGGSYPKVQKKTFSQKLTVSYRNSPISSKIL